MALFRFLPCDDSEYFFLCPTYTYRVYRLVNTKIKCTKSGGRCLLLRNRIIWIKGLTFTLREDALVWPVYFQTAEPGVCDRNQSLRVSWTQETGNRLPDSISKGGSYQVLTQSTQEGRNVEISQGFPPPLHHSDWNEDNWAKEQQ